MPCKSVFNSVMTGNQSEAERVHFWNHVRGLKPWSTHPMLSGPDYDPGSLIGFCIHGDGCQMFRDDSVMVWSISSVFSGEGLIGDVLVNKWPFVAIPEKFMRSPTVSWFTKFWVAVKFLYNSSMSHLLGQSLKQNLVLQPATTKVRKQVEKTVARLAAWSIHWSSKGIGPPVGFNGEEFPAGSSRFKMKDQVLANGWKTLAPKSTCGIHLQKSNWEPFIDSHI